VIVFLTPSAMSNCQLYHGENKLYFNNTRITMIPSQPSIVIVPYQSESESIQKHAICIYKDIGILKYVLVSSSYHS
jgi:hypothetical protein